MSKPLLKSFLNSNLIYFYFFILLFGLFFYNIPFLEYFFLVPLFYYLKKTKRLHLEHIIPLIILVALLNFSYFSGYGYKFMFWAVVAHLVFYIGFIYGSFVLLKKENYLISIPLFFYAFAYVLGFTIINNFWINYSATLWIIPNTVTIFGSLITTALLVMFNLLIVELFDMFSKKKFKVDYVTFGIFFVLLINFFFMPITYDVESNEKIKILGVQGNIEQEWMQRYFNYTQNLEKYLQLSSEGIKKYNPDIVVWPEYTFTHPIQFDFELQETLSQFAKENSVTLAVGVNLLVDESSNKSKRYDSLFFFNGEELEIYKAYEPATIFDDEVIRAKDNDKLSIYSSSLGAAICYEEKYPHVFTRQVTENDAMFFILIGNQFYLDKEKGLEITSLSSRVRAAETNRFIFRLENTGLSTVIDNKGNYVKRIEPNTEGLLFYEVPLITEKTLYSENRLFIEIAVFLLALLHLHLVLTRNKN